MSEKTRVDTIYESVRDDICLGRYAPGDIFHENELGREFEVSRTPIRQVLQRLAFEKLAVVRNGVGTIVRDHSANRAQDYLEMHAQMLATVAQLGLFVVDEDCEDDMVALLARARRLSASAEPERIWAVLKATQALCRRLLEDDLLRHMDEMLFYRTGPALMDGARKAPEAAVGILTESVAKLSTALEAPDRREFFTAQSANLRRYASLVGAAA